MQLLIHPLLELAIARVKYYSSVSHFQTSFLFELKQWCRCLNWCFWVTSATGTDEHGNGKVEGKKAIFHALCWPLARPHHLHLFSIFSLPRVLLNRSLGDFLLPRTGAYKNKSTPAADCWGRLAIALWAFGFCTWS